MLNPFSEIKPLLRVAWPAVLGSLLRWAAFSGYTFVLGHFGAVELAAATLGDAYINVTVMAVVMGFCQASDTLVSQAFGAGNRKRAWVVTLRAATLLTCLTPLAFGLCLTAGSVLGYHRLGEDPDVVAKATEYILWKMPFIWPRFMLAVLNRYLDGQSKTHYSMILTAISFLFSTVLLVLMFEVFDAGFTGAPLVSSIVVYLDLAMTLLVLLNDEAKEIVKGAASSYRTRVAFILQWFKVFCPCCRCCRASIAFRLPACTGAGRGGGCCKREYQQLPATDDIHDSGTDAELQAKAVTAVSEAVTSLTVTAVDVFTGWCEYIKLGLPGAVMVWFDWGSWEIAALVAGMGGAKQLAAHQVLTLVAAICYMSPAGLGRGTAILVGRGLGNNDAAKAIRAVIAAMALGAILAAAQSAGIFLFGRSLCKLYTVDEEVLDLANAAMLVVACYHGFDAMLAIASGVLRGAGQLAWGAVINTFCFVSFSIVGGYVMAQAWGWQLRGIWLGFGGGVASSFLCMAVLCCCVNWKKAAAAAAARAAEAASSPASHSGSSDEGASPLPLQPRLARARSTGHDVDDEAIAL